MQLFLKNNYQRFKDALQPGVSPEKNDTLFESGTHKCDILLIQPPPWDIIMPPLGIAYLSAYLEKYGYGTILFDINIAMYQLVEKNLKLLWEQESYQHWVNGDLFKNIWPRLEKTINENIIKEIQKIDTEFIGLSVNFASIKFSVELIRLIKAAKPQAKIIVGGWGCISEQMRRLFPEELIDIFVIGEGEETLKELIDKFKNKHEKMVAGAIFKERPFWYRPRSPIADLDQIPWPTFSGFKLSQYREKILPLFTSRGCIGNCSFCNDWVLSRPYRQRSAENIFAELQYHVKNNRVEHFSFKDLTCNGSMERINGLADLIIGSGLLIHWDSQAISRKEMTYEFLTKLKKSGCQTLIYGVESFSDNVLKKMRKLFTSEIAQRVLQDTCRAGINVIVNIIVGFPGETEEDFQGTVEAVKRNREYINQIGAVSLCLINNDSDLEICRGDYGLTMPPDSNERAKEWFGDFGKNTYQVRRERVDKFLEILGKLNLPYATKTI